MGLMKTLALEMEENGLAAARREGVKYGLDADAVEDSLTVLMGGDDTAYDMALGATETAEADALEATMRNPLGLVGSDLVAVGWDTDGQTWSHDEHGTGHAFYTACTVEASRLGLCCNPLDTPETF